MIKKNTLLFLGAGASRSYGLPLGIELRDEMEHDVLQILESYERLKPGDRLYKVKQAAIDLGHEFASFDELYRLLTQSLHDSIDAALQYRQDLADVGKLVLISAVLQYEVAFNTQSEKLISVDRADSWYSYLLRQMDATKSMWIANKLSIVTYNYDRTIEAAFERHLRVTFDLDCSDSQRMVDNMRIYHIHGRPGNLWGKDAILPRSNIEYEDLLKAASKFALVHEVVRQDVIDSLADRVREADQVVFLGFAFHPMSCSILSKAIELATSGKLNQKQIYSTGYKMYTAEKRLAERRLGLKRGDISWGEADHKNLRFLREQIVFE